MSGVTGAVVGAGIAAAGATVYAGSEAAGATRDATNASIAAQKDALGTQAQLSAPYRDLGESAIDKYKAILGLGPQGSKGMEDTLKSMPGYQFQLDQGTKSAVNQASLAGGISGNTLADLTRFNAGLADTTYQQEVDNLGRAVGTGQAAAAGQAQNVGAAGANIGNTLVGEGNTLAGINANTVVGLTKAAGGTVSNYMTLQALNNQGGGSIVPASTYSDTGLTSSLERAA